MKWTFSGEINSAEQRKSTLFSRSQQPATTPRNPLWKGVRWGGAGCLGMVFLLAFLAWTAVRPRQLGVREGKLASCPDSPNCVNTQSDNPRHAMRALPWAGDLASAQKDLLHVLTARPEMKIVTQQPGYIHVEVTSRWFRFVDDVEFYFDADSHELHMRSASRVGWSDLGVNRKRLQSLGQAFLKQHSPNLEGDARD